MKEELTALQEATAGLHEVFQTYVNSGFTEDQALKLLAMIIVLTKVDDDTSN